MEKLKYRFLKPVCKTDLCIANQMSVKHYKKTCFAIKSTVCISPHFKNAYKKRCKCLVLTLCATLRPAWVSFQVLRMDKGPLQVVSNPSHKLLPFFFCGPVGGRRPLFIIDFKVALH